MIFEKTRDMNITPEVIRDHGLTPDEFQKIRKLLGRDPSLTELGIFSVMWSEHCSYKSSRVLLKNLPTEGPYVLQGPGENAGIIDVGEGWACAFKIESHNHPSYVEPFQGATTGVGGILRDVFTMGARPIAIMDSLRFGPLSPFEAGARNTPPETLARNHSIVSGVVAGVAHYGNCFGVPNLGGETVFDPCYSGNPLVNAFALGVARQDQLFFGRASGIGNPVIYVGAKTGRDGIHGATMASEEFSEASEAKRPNVQVGDPFLEKLLLEACLEAMQTGAIVGIQDMGAAGLTSSSCEMGGRAGTGIEMDLDRVPQRESGMTAYEMMLSESQERMLLVAEKGREDEVFAVFRKWGLDAVTVGVVTSDGLLRIKHHGEVVAEIPNTALTDEAPRYHRPQREPARTLAMNPPPGWDSISPEKAFLRMAASPNLASKHWVYEQYDTMVRSNTLEGPGADAGVVRIKGTKRALAMALDGNGRYCRLSPKEGARLAIAEAARNVACTGALPVAATNCLNFGNPEKPEVMWQLAQAIDGLREACAALETPITGGNVSLYNETLGQGIDPTPIVGVVGILTAAEDEEEPRPMSANFRSVGHRVVLLSAASELSPEEALQRLGATEFAATIVGETWGLPPALDLERERSLQTCVRNAIAAGVLESAHDVSDGGLAFCLLESALGRPVERDGSSAGSIGARVNLRGDGSPLLTLFDESASRVVVSCTPEKLSQLQALARPLGVQVMDLGETCSDRLEVSINQKPVLALALTEVQQVWQNALQEALQAEAVAV